MTHLTLTELSHNKPIPERVEIVVVGAGMSGLYTTWRLLRENPNQDIVILDRLNRTGGRLDSDLIHFDDDKTVKEEEGGMRFTFDTMDDLMSLFLILGIDDQIVPFPMSSGGNNRLYFRGVSLTNSEAAEDNYSIWGEFYNLRPSERDINPKTIINTVFNRILDVNPDFTDRPKQRTPEFWQKFRLECQWNGVKLKNWTLWNLFTEMGYSAECISLLYRVSGFNGTFLSQMNAGAAYQLLEDFPADPQFRTLENGFSTLPNALVKEIGKERIFLKTHLQSISKPGDDDDHYALRYNTVDPKGNSKTGVVHAKKVILGLPRLALEKLFINSNALNELEQNKSEKLWDTLQTSTDQSLLKINLYYDKAWWGNKISGQPPVAFGPNFSDLPLGSVYPFYSIDPKTFAALEYQEWLKNKSKEAPKDIQEILDEISKAKYALPAALTIYCDFMNINFWKALQNNGPLFTSPLQEKYTHQNPQTVYAASQAVVREATKFFGSLFNTHYVPEPVLTSARIWDGSSLFDEKPSQQFGFGVHQWALQADDKQVIADLTEPLENIYTCGEAFSDYQGWVEGALRSADLVLAKGFGLKPISEVYWQEKRICPSDAIKAAYAKKSTALIREYIDPHFEPDCQPDSSDTPGEVGLDQSHFGILLSYFDQQ